MNKRAPYLAVKLFKLEVIFIIIYENDSTCGNGNRRGVNDKDRAEKNRAPFVLEREQTFWRATLLSASKKMVTTNQGTSKSA